MRRECDCLFVAFVELRRRLFVPDEEGFDFLKTFLVDDPEVPFTALSTIDLLY